MRLFYISLVLLFLLCFCFIILSSISYAYTWEDFTEFCGNVNNTTVTGDANTIANRIYNNKLTIENAMNNANYNLEDFHSYLSLSFGSTYFLYFINKNNLVLEIPVRISGQNFHWGLENAQNIPYINLSNWSVGVSSNSAPYGNGAVIGLLANSTTYGSDTDYLGDKFIYSVINRTNLTGESPYYFADGRVGNYYYKSNYWWYIVQNNNYIKLDDIQEQITGGYLFGLYLTDEKLVNLNTSDNCCLIYGTEELTRYQSENFKITYQLSPEVNPSGTITNSSGDVTGSIDLSGVESRLDYINQSIISGDYAILQNQKENQSFWEATYNSLFSMDSGDVNDVYLMVKSYFPSGDTPLTVYDTIFGAYGNEPDDFIIRWDDHPLKITWFGGETLYSGDFIYAGYMNFSKECRDNVVLGNIKFWLNTLLTIFIFIAYYKFLYKCYCDMLGVISEDLQEQPEEHRPIGFGRGDK